MSNYIKIIILPGLTIIAVTFIWIFVKPIFDDTRVLNQIKKPQIESLLLQENDLQQRAQKLSEEAGNSNQGETVTSALPENTETKNLLTQIEFIIEKNNLTLADISILDNSPSVQSAEGIIDQSGNTYKEINGIIDIKGGYGQFKQLLKDIKKLNRIITINKITITSASGDEGSAIGKYTINMTAYWQPTVAPNDIRSGLENREYNQSSPTVPSGIPTSYQNTPSGAGSSAKTDAIN